MPEGDTIFRLAARLRPLLVGEHLNQVRSRKHGVVSRLNGHKVERIHAHGKHLLLELQSGFTVRVHLGIRGRCHTYSNNERWRMPAWRATLILASTAGEVVFFDAPQVEIGRTKLMPGGRALSQLGPDLLAETCDLDQVVARAQAHARSPIADVLLHQGVCAGIGNVFKCEVLFIERVHPWHTVDALHVDTLRQLFTSSRLLLRANIGDGPRVTVPRKLRQRGARVWVYNRVNRPCYRCRTIVESRQSGDMARTTYFCPKCQPLGAARVPHQ